MINHRPVDEPTEARRAVNLAAPLRGSGRPEKNQMFEAKKRFGLAVAFLLFQKSAESETPMVPDDRGRAESDDAAGLLQAPAKIDIVAGLVIFGIEAADILKCPPVKCHVTARDVFGNRVGDQNVTRSARRGRDTSLGPILRGWTDIRATNAGIIAADECAH